MQTFLSDYKALTVGIAQFFKKIEILIEQSETLIEQSSNITILIKQSYSDEIL